MVFEIILIVFFLGFFGFIIGSLVSAIRSNKKRWNSIPSIEEYKLKHPDCITNRGMKCVVCNSTSIKNLGFGNAESTNRIFICNHCGTQLYKTNWQV